MAWVMRRVAVCRECGHEWLPLSGYPKRCAKCKSGKWNVGGEKEVKEEEQDDAPVARVERLGTKKCVLHNLTMKDFGTSWWCDGPPGHKVFKGEGR